MAGKTITRADLAESVNRAWVVSVQSQFGRVEPHVHAVLRCHSDGLGGFVLVLHIHHARALAARVLVGISDPQGAADLGTSLGKRIIVAGLDMVFKVQPFGPMPGLMAIAEFVTKVHAVCVNCGAAAHYSYRKVEQQQTVLLGETESYEARCRSCFHGQN